MKSSKILSNLTYNSAFSLISNIFPLLTIPYLTRVLSQDNLGEVFYFQSLSKAISIFCLLGIPIYGVKLVAQNAQNINQRNSIVGNLIATILLLTTITATFGVIYYFVNPFKLTSFHIVLLTMILSSVFSLEWAVQGMEEFKFLAVRNFIIRLLSLLAIFLFVRDKNDGLIYFIILSSVSVLIMISNFKLILSKISLNIALIKIERKYFKSIILLFGSIIAISLYTSFDVILLEKLSDLQAVAQYNVAMKITQAASVIIASFGTVFFPLLSANYGKNSYKKLINISIQTTFIVGGIVLIVLSSYSKEIIEIIAGKQYVAQSSLLIILSLNPLTIGLSQIFGVQILTIEGNENKFLFAVLIGGLFSIATNYFLIPLFNATGASITNALAEIIVLGCSIILGKHKLASFVNSDFKLIVRNLLFLVVIVNIFRSTLLYLDMNTLYALPIILLIIYFLFFKKTISIIETIE